MPLFRSIITLGLLIFLGCASPSVHENALPWKSALFNQERVNVTKEQVVLPLKRKALYSIWTFSDLLHPHGLSLSASPVIKDNTAYLGNGSGEFHAINLINKSTIWRMDTKSQIDTSATLDGDVLYFGTGEGVIHSLDRESGEELWRYETKATILASPLIVGDILYVASADNRIYAIEKETGKVRWQYGRRGGRQIGARIMASPASEGERVYHLFSDGHLLSLDRTTGKVIWEKPVFDPTLLNIWRGRKSPLLAGNSIFIIDGEGAVMQIDKESGKELKSYNQFRAVDFIVRDNIIFLVGNERIAAIRVDSGEVEWRKKLEDISPLSAFGAGDYIFVLSNMTRRPLGIDLFAQKMGRVDGFNVKSGDLYRVDEFNSAITANAVFSGNRLLIVVDKGFVVSYSP
ncbi:MAG: PQQ-binding-like beta-propeller repeat protein [Deltaproteobacteria bacterium]|nr:PQQ-binding-like beta-propeller repeat protein [Deltaproteobacteria bacterium]